MYFCSYSKGNGTITRYIYSKNDSGLDQMNAETL